MREEYKDIKLNELYSRRFCKLPYFRYELQREYYHLSQGNTFFTGNHKFLLLQKTYIPSAKVFLFVPQLSIYFCLFFSYLLNYRLNAIFMSPPQQISVLLLCQKT